VARLQPRERRTASIRCRSLLPDGAIEISCAPLQTYMPSPSTSRRKKPTKPTKPPQPQKPAEKRCLASSSHKRQAGSVNGSVPHRPHRHHHLSGGSAASDSVTTLVRPEAYDAYLSFNNRFSGGGFLANVANQVAHRTSQTLSSVAHQGVQAARQAVTRKLQNINTMIPPTLAGYSVTNRKRPQDGGAAAPLNPLIVGPDYYEVDRAPALPHGMRVSLRV
jgi:hypothetical protein